MRAWLEKPAARRVAAIGSVIGVVAGLVGTVGNLERVPEYVCRVPGLHALCGRVGVGNVAGPVEQAAWDAAQKSSGPAQLRDYLQAYPEGVHAAEARTRLAACRPTPREQWVAERRSLPLYVAAGTASDATLAAAQDAARRRGASDASAACAGFVGEFRVKRSEAMVREWACRERDGGSACAFDGLAVCELETRQIVNEEICR